MTEVEVINVAMDLDFKTPVVLLKEKRGKRKLPIWMGLPEAQSIARAMENIHLLFSSPDDLTGRLIEKFKAQVDKVIINELKGNIYYAKIFVKINREIVEVDAFPSDAIALALKFKACIYIDEDRIAARKNPINDSEVNEFKQKLKNIKPEDFSF